MATYGEYLARGIDPAAATAWAAADAEDDGDESNNLAQQHKFTIRNTAGSAQRGFERRSVADEPGTISGDRS